MPPAYSPMAFAVETERLELRLRTPDDGEWNLELLGEHPGGTTRTLQQARDRLAQQRAESLDNGICFLTITRLSEGHAIGYCGLFVGRASFEEPELAYELLRRAHGHGYATEAARAVVVATTATGRERLWSTVRPGNGPSFRVLEKLGFRRDRIESDTGGDLVYPALDLH